MCWPTRGGALVRWPRSTATLLASSTSLTRSSSRGSTLTTARVRSTLDAAVAAGAPHELEFRIVRPAGDIRWVHAKGRVHRDEKGVFARVLGVSLDVTQQKRAEEERDRLHSLEVTARAEAAERTGSAASSTIGWPTRWASPTRASSSTRRWRGKILCGPTASCTRRRRW